MTRKNVAGMMATIISLMFNLTLVSCGSNELNKSNVVFTTSNTESERITDDETNVAANGQAESSISEEPILSKQSVDHWDKVLTDYESFIDSYIRAMKKAKAGDMSVMSEYPALLENAEKLGDELQENQGQLTFAQAKRFIKLQTKLVNAAANLM